MGQTAIDNHFLHKGDWVRVTGIREKVRVVSIEPEGVRVVMPRTLRIGLIRWEHVEGSPVNGAT